MVIVVTRYIPFLFFSTKRKEEDATWLISNFFSSAFRLNPSCGTDNIIYKMIEKKARRYGVTSIRKNKYGNKKNICTVYETDDCHLLLIKEWEQRLIIFICSLQLVVLTASSGASVESTTNAYPVTSDSTSKGIINKLNFLYLVSMEMLATDRQVLWNFSRYDSASRPTARFPTWSDNDWHQQKRKPSKTAATL